MFVKTLKVSHHPLHAKNHHFNPFICILYYQSNMPYNLNLALLVIFLKRFILFVTGVLKQPSSETIVHNVMAMLLRHGDTIITSQKHDKQSQSLAYVNVSPPMRISDHIIVQMQTSGLLFHLRQLQWKCKYIKWNSYFLYYPKL